MRIFCRALLTSCFLFLIQSSIGAQERHSKINPLAVDFNKRSDFPEKLLESRSMGLIWVDKENKDQSIWKSIAKLSQPKFSKLGIDVVGWYQVENVTASTDTRTSFVSILKQRQIENLVLFFFENEQLNLYITKFNGKTSLVDSKQAAWQESHSKMDVLLSSLQKKLYASNKKKKNLLVIEYPELFEKVPLSIRNKFEEYSRDLKLDRLAVRFPSKQGRNIDQWRADSLIIVQKFKTYPYKYKFVERGVTPQTLQDKNFQYVVRWVYGTPLQIQRTYGYNSLEAHTEANRKALATNPVLQIKAPHYKIMVQHVRTGDMYFGKHWDGATSVEAAVDKFLLGLTNSIKK